MRKIYLLTLILVFVLSIVVSAEGLEFVGGPTYNTLKSDTTINQEDFGEINLEIDSNSGAGYYAGARYWFNDKLGVGLGYDSVNADLVFDVNFDIPGLNESATLKEEIELDGLYGELVYKINNVLTLTGSLVNYDLVVDGSLSSAYFDEDIKLLEGSGTGYIIGADLDYPMNENLSFRVNAGYRNANIDIDKILENDTPDELDVDIKLDGFRFAAGLSYQF